MPISISIVYTYVYYIYISCLDIYIYFACLFVCLCPINVKTAEPTRGKVCGWSNLKKFADNKIHFFKTLKINDFFNKIQSANLFSFVFQCLRREHVHSWSRRWAQSALKAYYILFILNLSPFLQSFIAYFSNNSNTSTDNSSLSLSSWHSSETGGYKYAT